MPKGISGTTRVGTYTIEWYEIKENDGPSPRGIGVTLKDHAGSKYEFNPINPNPHSSPTYNQGNQAKFYAAGANHITERFEFDATDVTCPYANLPSSEPYNAAEMNKLLANALGKKIFPGKTWDKLSKPDQAKFISSYPKAIDAYKKSEEVRQAAAAWAKHVKRKGRTSFSWEGLTYKLPMPA